MTKHEAKPHFLENRKSRFLILSSIIFQWFENIAKQSWMLWPIPCWIARISWYSPSLLKISSKPQQKPMNSNTFSSFFCGVFGRPERQEVSNTSRFGRVSPHFVTRTPKLHNTWIVLDIMLMGTSQHPDVYLALVSPSPRQRKRILRINFGRCVGGGGVTWTRNKII